MTICARLIADEKAPPSWFRIRKGGECEVTFRVADNASGQPVDWSGRVPRFRIYSQLVDRLVLLEVSDPERCVFEPHGVWKLRLTADETASLPVGGMSFTLEYGDSHSNYQLGLQGGISCGDKMIRFDQAEAGLGKPR